MQLTTVLLLKHKYILGETLWIFYYIVLIVINLKYDISITLDLFMSFNKYEFACTSFLTIWWPQTTIIIILIHLLKKQNNFISDNNNNFTKKTVLVFSLLLFNRRPPVESKSSGIKNAAVPHYCWPQYLDQPHRNKECFCSCAFFFSWATNFYFCAKIIFLCNQIFKNSLQHAFWHAAIITILKLPLLFLQPNNNP